MIRDRRFVRRYGLGLIRPRTPRLSPYVRSGYLIEGRSLAAGYTVTKSEGFAGVLEEAVALNRPALIDVHVDVDIRPPATGAWELPPLTLKEPVFGGPWRPE